MITVALSKGRLLDDFITYLEKQQLTHYLNILEEQSRSLFIEVDNVKFLFAKGPDVPIYVESGIADIGIVGSDIIAENRYNVLNVSQLPFGECYFALAGPPGVGRFNRVASKYTNIAARYFKEQKQDVALIHLHGSVELAPLLGLADGIVDIVQSGNTLRDNGLVVYDRIMEIHGRLITNKQTFYTRENEIYDFLKEIGVIK